MLTTIFKNLGKSSETVQQSTVFSENSYSSLYNWNCTDHHEYDVDDYEIKGKSVTDYQDLYEEWITLSGG